MKITEDVRKYAAELGLSDEQARQAGIEEKSKEFVSQCSDVFAKARFRSAVALVRHRGESGSLVFGSPRK